MTRSPRPFCGVDFGTSNSTVGLFEAGRGRLAPLEGDRVVIPSAIFFNFESGAVHFGRRAIDDYAEGVEGRLMRALKSVLGTALMRDKTRIRSRSVAFTDIIGLFLARLKHCAEAAAGAEIPSVVLGRPVHFVDGDEIADRAAEAQLAEAARAVGFQTIAFQFEPIAAALDYESRLERERLALIVDIGGGTADFSIVRVSPERARVADRRADILANVGAHIGGTDFDRLLSMAEVMPAFGYRTPTADGKRELPTSYYFDLASWHLINRLYTSKVQHQLREVRREAARPELVRRLISVLEHRQGHLLAAEVEAAKIALTRAPAAEIALAVDGERLAIPVGRAAFEAAIERATARIADTIRTALADSGLGRDAIQALFLTGGSTQIPFVRDSILAMFPAAEVVEGDMFGSVGLGLALDARARFG